MMCRQHSNNGYPGYGLQPAVYDTGHAAEHGVATDAFDRSWCVFYVLCGLGAAESQALGRKIVASLQLNRVPLA